MPELHGYDTPNASAYQLQQRMLEFLKTKEEEHGIPIHVHFIGNERSALREDEADSENPILRIYDFATPGELLNLQTRDSIYFRDTRETGSSIYSFPLSRRNAVRYPAPGFEQIFAGDPAMDGVEWLGVYDYLTIWYKFGLKNLGSTWNSSDQLLDQTEKMKACLGQFIDQIVDKDFFLNKRREALKATRDAFISYAATATAGEVTRLRAQVTNTEAAIAQLSQQQQAQALNLKRHNRALEAAEAAKLQDDQVFELSFDQLMENVKIEKIDYSASEGKLILTTVPLYLHSPDRRERTPLGTMRIDFYPTDRRVLIFNMTNRRGERQHPHIPAAGDPCWGGIETVVRNYLRDGELLAFVEICLDFLETYNPEDSWGRWASHWFHPQQAETQYLQEDGRWLTQTEMTTQPIEETNELSQMTEELGNAMNAEEVTA